MIMIIKHLLFSFCLLMMVSCEKLTSVLTSPQMPKTTQSEISEQNKLPLDQKFQNIIKKYKTPHSIKFEVLTEKYQVELSQIIKTSYKTNSQSEVYFVVQFFSDDSDLKSPLIVQIKFKSVKNDALLWEESINL